MCTCLTVDACHIFNSRCRCTTHAKRRETIFIHPRRDTHTQTHVNGCFRFYFKQRNWSLKHENRLFSSYTRTTYRLIRKLKTRLLLFLFCFKQLVGLSCFCGENTFEIHMRCNSSATTTHTIDPSSFIREMLFHWFIQQTAVKQTRTNSSLSDLQLEFDVKCHRWTNKHGNWCLLQLLATAHD